MRTITLELVRHGPAHNQLLSPLTQYLALCENHPAVTLQLPLEHSQMLCRLSALAYHMGKESREFQLRDTAQLLGELLARIPGLTADMNRRDLESTEGSDQGVDDDTATHLRLVLSASELALLPFELALAPIGFPGAGQPLLLQSVRPVAITRETRRVAEGEVVWPERTRVLFVVASPPELPPPPAAAHLLALRRTLEPWIGTRSGAAEHVTGATHDDRLGRYLTVLTDASLEAIEAACSTKDYTHVHILAHGVEYTEGYDMRFGLLLHDSAYPMGPADHVSGERLATALRTSRKGASGQLARPAVVTLASCYSGGVGSVTGVGASIAHALHADGIPMVIASQFPLSFGGSVRMVEILYGGLLSGEDPRRLLIDLRRSLHTEFPDTHDWASITAYSSLPSNFDRQLAAVQIQRARRTIDVALELADEVVARARQVEARAGGTAAAEDKQIAAAMERVRESRARLARLVNRLPSQRSRIVSLLASSDKREAELEVEAIQRQYDFDFTAEDSTSIRYYKVQDELVNRAWPLLLRAHKLYDEAFDLDAGAHWAMVQYISLSVVMRYAWPKSEKEEIGKLWTLAEVHSLRDLPSVDYARRAWALGNLIELYLLAPAIYELKHVKKHSASPKNWSVLASQYAKELAKMARPGAFEIFSTRRQIERYLVFYPKLATLPPVLRNIASEVLALLPTRQLEEILQG